MNEGSNTKVTTLTAREKPTNHQSMEATALLDLAMFAEINDLDKRIWPYPCFLQTIF